MKEKYLILVLLWSSGLFIAASYSPFHAPPQRPLDIWAFRSVLDKKPRMLTIALHQECYLAYDLTQCKIYKVWKGGVAMDGAAYTNKKDVQPTSWGAPYLLDSLQPFRWNIQISQQTHSPKPIYKGYVFRNQQIYLQYAFALPSRDTIWVEERPEFVKNKEGKPTLERVFKTTRVPQGVQITLQSPQTKIVLAPNAETSFVHTFDPLPDQAPPTPTQTFAHVGRALMEKSDCFVCHKIAEDEVGPSFQKVAQRYQNDKKTTEKLVEKIRDGGTGVWGNGVMNSHALLTEGDLTAMVNYIFTLKPKAAPAPKTTTSKDPSPTRPTKPGFGMPLEGVHPSYDLQTLHTQRFNPRVGAIAFLPDGRLLVTTWDTVGGVYVLDNVTTGDTNQITVKRIASGLAEPLGIEVVDGKIYVLQKQELTQLIDHNNDDIIDEYRAICHGWGVTADFHEFAFGLVHKDGFFYATLSMAMRLKPDEKQLPDRGRTIKISKDGSFESVNYGLRTPNGIGLGVDNELFVTDNQGQWLPANKLIHIKKDEYHGMEWGWLHHEAPPKMALPAIWLPEHEIGNSPSEPVLVKEGPYQGQLLHGDVTHGGIKRDFLEKIKGEYQGAVFRFSQGFEAGVNRLRWGPDGALYVGEVGMVGGGWSWHDKVRGLQKIKYNGKSTFEMLAIRAKNRGFEIEFTQPLAESQQLRPADFLIQQWWYEPTKNYGGPKMDLTTLSIAQWTISKDRKRLYLEIPHLKKEHVIYFRLPDDLKSQTGNALWSSEAWYTLNRIPD